MRRQDRRRLGVGLGPEGVAERRQLMAQGLEILDDAVVDDGDPVGRNRMGVGLGRQTMGSPAGVADADHPLDRLPGETFSEVDELALGAPALNAAVDEGRNPGRIIAAVFETSKSFEKRSSHRVLGDDADDAAHQRFFPRSRCRISVARPGLSTCWPRAIDSASAGTSSVMTLPAGTIAAGPTDTR